MLQNGIKGGSPSGTQFGLLNVDVERCLVRVGGIDVRGLLFADHATIGHRTYTDAGSGIGALGTKVVWTEARL